MPDAIEYRYKKDECMSPHPQANPKRRFSETQSIMT